MSTTASLVNPSSVNNDNSNINGSSSLVVVK